jgi:hypothetical protein
MYHWQSALTVLRVVRDVLTSVTLSWPMDRYRRTHCMASTITWLESPGFLLVGTLKYPCVGNEETLHYRIVHACQTICSYPGIFERMPRSMMRRALNLMEDIFSTCNKCAFTAITHKLMFRDTCWYGLFFLVLIRGTRTQSLSAAFNCTLYNTAWHWNFG